MHQREGQSEIGYVHTGSVGIVLALSGRNRSSTGKMFRGEEVAYCNHHGGGWHVSVTSGYHCVDLRKPTKTGIACVLPSGRCLKKRFRLYIVKTPRVSNRAKNATRFLRLSCKTLLKNLSLVTALVCMCTALCNDCIILCVFNKLSHNVFAIFVRLLTTDKSRHEYIVKGGISSKATHNSTHVNIVTSKNTIKHTIMSTASTDNTL